MNEQSLAARLLIYLPGNSVIPFNKPNFMIFFPHVCTITSKEAYKRGRKNECKYLEMIGNQNRQHRFSYNVNH